MTASLLLTLDAGATPAQGEAAHLKPDAQRLQRRDEASQTPIHLPLRNSFF